MKMGIVTMFYFELSQWEIVHLNDANNFFNIGLNSHFFSTCTFADVATAVAHTHSGIQLNSHWNFVDWFHMSKYIHID